MNDFINQKIINLHKEIVGLFEYNIELRRQLEKAEEHSSEMAIEIYKLNEANAKLKKEIK